MRSAGSPARVSCIICRLSGVAQQASQPVGLLVRAQSRLCVNAGLTYPPALREADTMARFLLAELFVGPTD
jgi:hypothetical protein